VDDRSVPLPGLKPAIPLQQLQSADDCGSRLLNNLELVRADRAGRFHGFQAWSTWNDTTVPPKGLGSALQESASASTRSSPLPCASLASGLRSRTSAGSPGL
jgi:hypothetical protein